jgi:NAD(P)H-flavin reductase/hemoglobin-like flavoprotein
MGNLSHLLKESWYLVEEQQDKMAGYFYARIFLSNPHLRDLFPVQMDIQRARLLGAIVTAVQNFDDPERVEEYLRSLGRDHRKFQVSPEHYGIVGEALLEALRTFGGDQWTLEYEQAWRDAYGVIAAKMVAGAQADTNPPYWSAEVLGHQRRGLDVAVFTCRPLEPFRYVPGQYVSIECAHQPRLWRTYSIANAPRKNGTIDFHVRAVGAGWVSGALVRRLREGDIIKIAAPMGSMTLNRSSTRDIVCVAGGTGLAPIKALIEELAQLQRAHWVHLFFGARDRDDLYDLDALRRMAQQFPWLSVVPAVSDDDGFDGEHGTVADVMSRHGPWEDKDFYVSGSAAMVRATMRRLAEMRVPSTRIRYDTFGDI